MKRIEATVEQKLGVLMMKMEKSVGAVVVQKLSGVLGTEEILDYCQRWMDRDWTNVYLEEVTKKVGGRGGRGHEESLLVIRLEKLEESGTTEVRLLMRRSGDQLRYYGVENQDQETGQWARMDPMAASHVLGSLR